MNPTAVREQYTRALIADLRHQAQTGQPINAEKALAVLRLPTDYLWDVFACASEMKHHYFDDRPLLCSIVNAKCGACGEDCAFCAQSVHHNTAIEAYPLRSAAELLAARRAAAELPIQHFGVVTSGPRLSPRDLSAIEQLISRNPPSDGVHWCASLGHLTRDELAELRAAGLKRFHHNLETAPSYFPRICTTHSSDDRLQTVRHARAAGLEVCCGGILGIGEPLEQRVELAMTLQELHVDSIPLNFLIPIPGTRLQNIKPIHPIEALLAISMFRLTNPWAEIKVCAGRIHLRDLQSMIFAAGANGMMIGDLLTVAGRNINDDLQMLRDLGLLDHGPTRMDR